MKSYTIEIEDTVSEFLEFSSIVFNKPIEELIADAIFNQSTLILQEIKEKFTYQE